MGRSLLGHFAIALQSIAVPQVNRCATSQSLCHKSVAVLDSASEQEQYNLINLFYSKPGAENPQTCFPIAVLQLSWSAPLMRQINAYNDDPALFLHCMQHEHNHDRGSIINLCYSKLVLKTPHTG